MPHDRATTQNNLGTALWRLGERESGTARLAEAVAAYREALQEHTRERVPLDWAITQNNLGNALFRLGERESGTARLAEAVAAYREALQERTRERVPLDWAMTHNNLAITLGNLAYRFVLARDFAKTLEAAEEAISLAPGAIWLYTNRAHALMFLGRVDEARALYIQYRGTKNVHDEKSWETTILDDFADLRKAGLTNPLMDEIEKQFTAAG